ncbi:MAG: hypothetical protein ABIS36_26665 [Chryseolinea sp.]
MKRSTTIGLSFCLISVAFNFPFLFAQVITTSPDIRANTKRVGILTGYDVFNNPQDEDDPIVGTPYFDDKYSKATLYTKLGIFSNLEMRYNIYLDRVEFKQKDSVVSLGPDSIVHKIALGNNVLVVEKLTVRGKTQNSYFVRLDSGRITLISKPSVEFKARQEARPIETDGKPPSFIRKANEYYIKIGSGICSKISGIRGLIEILPDKKKEAQDFAKREKTSPRDEKDLLMLVRYYNSL